MVKWSDLAETPRDAMASGRTESSPAEERDLLFGRARNPDAVTGMGANGASALGGGQDQAKDLAGVASSSRRRARSDEVRDETLHVDLLNRAEGNVAEAGQDMGPEVACIARAGLDAQVSGSGDPLLGPRPKRRSPKLPVYIVAP